MNWALCALTALAVSCKEKSAQAGNGAADTSYPGKDRVAERPTAPDYDNGTDAMASGQATTSGVNAGAAAADTQQDAGSGQQNANGNISSGGPDDGNEAHEKTKP